MKLFGIAVSPFVGRVLLIAELKKIDLPLVTPSIEGAFGKLQERISALEQDPSVALAPIQFMADTPYMKEISPQGRMPALECDGRYLGESAAIAQFLDERFPEPPLMPSDPWARAKVRQLCLICDLSLTPQVLPLAQQIDPATRDESQLREAKVEIARSLFELEQIMGSGPWAWADRATLADCLMVYTVLFYQCVLTTTPENLGMTAFDPARPFPSHPRLATWWAHLSRDAVFAAAIGRYREAYRGMFGPMSTPRAFGNWLKARSPRS
jgi:glutathione S-transferase